MVGATSDTERPVPKYLSTCLQFTAPATRGPAVPSNSATPITSVPSFMREPPCACAQPLDADRAARGTPSGCIATPRREGKLRRPAPSRPARAGHWARTGRRSRDMGMRAGVMMMLSVAGPALAAAPMLDRIDVAGGQAPAVRLPPAPPRPGPPHHPPPRGRAPARAARRRVAIAAPAAAPPGAASEPPTPRPMDAAMEPPAPAPTAAAPEPPAPAPVAAAIEAPAPTPTAAAPEPPAPAPVAAA